MIAEQNIAGSAAYPRDMIAETTWIENVDRPTMPYGTVRHGWGLRVASKERSGLRWQSESFDVGNWLGFMISFEEELLRRERVRYRYGSTDKKLLWSTQSVYELLQWKRQQGQPAQVDTYRATVGLYDLPRLAAGDMSVLDWQGDIDLYSLLFFQQMSVRAAGYLNKFLRIRLRKDAYVDGRILQESKVWPLLTAIE